MNPSLAGYAGRRILQAAMAFVIITLILSAIANVRYEIIDKIDLEWSVRQAVGAALTANPGMTAEDSRQLFDVSMRSALEAKGMADPLPLRIVRRASQIMRFDFGRDTGSTRTIRGYGAEKSDLVSDIIWESFLPTVLLFGGAFVVQIAVALMLGIRNARRPGSVGDRTTSVVGIATISVPTMVAALFAVSLFVFAIRIFPSEPWVYRGPASLSEVGPWLWDFVSHYTLPFLTLVVIGFGGWAFAFRNLVIGVLQEDFVASARARGISERRVVFGHAAGAAAPPLVTCITYGLMSALWGSFFVEPIFQWPGIGGLYLLSIQKNDFTLFFGITVMMTAFYLAATLVLDLTYGLLDPRIKVAQESVLGK